MGVYGLEGPGVKDVYPIGGKVCLWLPNGTYTFTIGSQTYSALVSGGAVAVAPYERVDFLRWNGTEMVTDEVVCQPLFASAKEIGSKAGSGYVVKGDVKTTDLKVNGTAYLILADGATLTANGTKTHAGIEVCGGNALTVYCQSAGTGKLEAKGGEEGAGIGGGNEAMNGDITINGGSVTATTVDYGAGIGG